MVKVKGKIVAKVKKGGKKPLKVGRVMPKNIGGIANAKVVAIVKKEKNDG